MTKKNLLKSIVIGVVLGVLGGMLGLNVIFPVEPVNASTAVNDPLIATLTSHLKWDSLQGEANVIWYSPDGETQEYVNTFAIQQPNQANISSISVDGKGESGQWISDGETAYALDLEKQEFSSSSLPTFSSDLSKLPTTLAEVAGSNIVYPHPFSMVIPFPVKEYLYPQGFSQGIGQYALLGEEKFLDRLVWVVEYQNDTNKVTAWIDEETGVILKYIQWSDGKLFAEVRFTIFQVNPKINGDLFKIDTVVNSLGD